MKTFKAEIKEIKAAKKNDSHLYMQTPRRVTKPFPAKYRGTCSKCYLEIEEGDLIRYNSEGEIVHHSHKRVEPVVEICDRCWLTKPCECDA